MTGAVHFRLSPTTYACGIERRQSVTVTAAYDRPAVTCGSCRRTKVFTGGTL